MSEIKMKYSRRVNESRFVSDMRERWNKKYEQPIAWSLTVAAMVFLNWLVWFYNGFVAEMIISVPLSFMCGGALIAFIVLPIIQWIYVKRHRVLYAKEQKFYNEQEEFNNFVKTCRGSR